MSLMGKRNGCLLLSLAVTGCFLLVVRFVQKQSDIKVPLSDNFGVGKISSLLQLGSDSTNDQIPGQGRKSGAHVSKHMKTILTNQTIQTASYFKQLGDWSIAYPDYKSLYRLMIKQARNQIAFIFKDGILDIPFRPGGKVQMESIRRVLIVSSWRSGSTFLGDLLKSYDGAFYSFEPLHIYLKNQHLEEGGDVEKSITLLRDIAQCNFTRHSDYIEYLRHNTYLMEYNNKVWQFCFLNRTYCFNKEFLSEICSYLPLNIIKTVRLGLNPVEPLLRDPSLNFKVIQLLRDPRGFMHSRKQIDWCKSATCSDVPTVCRYLLYDLKISNRYSKEYPDRYLSVLYEDLSTKTESVTAKILSFLGLTFKSSIKKFIAMHTNLKTNKNVTSSPYTTYRNSQRIPFAWRNESDFEEIRNIQLHCKAALQMMGLRYFHSDNQFHNKSISVLL